MNKKIDKTWIIKHEGHLNRGNIKLKDEKYLELVKEMKKGNDKLGSKKWINQTIELLGIN